MKSAIPTGLAVHGHGRRLVGYATTIAFLALVSAFPAVLASTPDSPSNENGENKSGEEEEHQQTFSGGPFEYRKIGADLVSLWREYTAMSDALSHALRDYNVATYQEQRSELIRLLAAKQKAAESSIFEQKTKAKRLPRTVIYGELAGLKEIKAQMKRLDEKIQEIPDYKNPEQNLLLLQSRTTPVNIAMALGHTSAALFHRSITAYYVHTENFTKKYEALRTFLDDVKMSPEGSGRINLIQQAAEEKNFFDTDAPISLHFAVGK